jgi:hypothetical protein
MTLGWRRRARWLLACWLSLGSAVAAAVAQNLTASTAASSPEIRLAALTDDGRLLVFSSGAPERAEAKTIQGASDPFCGIDERPANGLLYGVTTTSEVYTIDPETGTAELVSTLTRPFDGEMRSGVDFTPLADRLRLVSHDGQNLRINVDVGAAAIDGPLVYAPGDPNHGERAEIAAVAYTKSLPQTAATEMYDIDAHLDILVRQEPPNDGILRTVGSLGVDFPLLAGFEIISGPDGSETAFAAFRDSLFRIDLQSGRATRAGSIGGSRGEIVGLSGISGPRAEGRP